MTRTVQAPKVAGRRSVRVGPVSGVLRLRPALVLLAGLVLLLLLFVLNVGLGEYQISPAEVLTTLVGGGDRAEQVIIWELRMPRSLTGLLVGAALGAAGAIMQAIARNPLASPDMLGITWGAGTAATAVIVLGGSVGTVTGALESVGLPLVALAGGLLVGLAVYVLSYRNGVDSYRLVLVGVGMSALAGNATYWLLSVGDVNDAGRAMVWLTGSLNARGWEHVVPVAIVLALLVPLTLVGAHVLGALQFDDDTVRGLGIRMDAARGGLLIAAVLLAAVATAAAGPIQFVALAVPQIALRLARTAMPPLLTSMVLGAALVVGSDLISRTAFGGIEMPVGIVTSVLGAPYLIYLLVRRYREVRA
ncbi:iron complex transport system permease protein [Saccharopolyspora erythraea NRRL 2338]|uniref:Fe(3+) enterobactin transport system permease protein n=2 Tax=Saccharopolyspora erythraea TaxID=1836 RepID=A4F6T6_SACEN|nr:iron ABC transporter permease [Saccharopolyspora erythraea]EQD87291.1 iron ABC transporter [Saccharopolyspora erythraea D]PFG93563.1 iron complex transport system permease protein [Saccharopolyspora erythraea NRRL 2338]QRK90413.1 iron ABC transporter permease [Saccharopolyspora erythraea]CAL99760.1 Fe(3+) enterobactin transport system permease protein [Saccharopolyspora erythraea NRRL 2338]